MTWLAELLAVLRELAQRAPAGLLLLVALLAVLAAPILQDALLLRP